MLLLLPVMYWVTAASSEPLSEEEQRIVDYVDAHFEASVTFLEQIVNINSGTMNHAGVRQVGRIFEPEFQALGFEVRWIPVPAEVNRSGHLFAETHGNQGNRLLLIGHLDTVFEKDSPFQQFVRMDSIATGPGVSDMKGGDIVILYALKAVHSVHDLKNTGMTVALMGDEERPGYPLALSRSALIEAGKRSDIALGFEGMIPGTATVARRGISTWRLTITGIEAHSSGIFGDDVGCGAIFEAARILNAFYEQLRGEEYLTFNPGIIVGGTSTEYDTVNARGSAFGKINVIAKTATVEGDLRFISSEQRERARAAMRRIVTNNNLAQTSGEITFSNGNPAMPPTPGNMRLLRLYDAVSRDIGYGPVEPFDPGGRGAADIAFVAADVDGLDGLGVHGDGEHGSGEKIYLTSLAQATKCAAVMIYRLLQ